MSESASEKKKSLRTRFLHVLSVLFRPWSHFIFFFATLLSVAFSVCLFFPDFIATLNSLPLAINIILAIHYSICLIGVFYFAFMWLYVIWKQKKTHLKYLPEVVILLGAFALSVACKFYTYCITRPEYLNDFSGVIKIMGISFYGAIGGLQFEGLPINEEAVGNCFSLAMYFGSSVLAGLIFFSVIASTAFSEMYCRVWIWFRNTSKKDIYVFTALNDETLNIAKSISEDERKAKSSVIIFAGPSLKPFDRHDPNCIEAMGRRYLYWSFSTKKKKNNESSNGESFLNRIGLYSWLCRPTSWNEVHVFAFDSDNDHIPNEEENMDYVFMDARNQLALMKKKAQKKKVSFVADIYDEEKGGLVRKTFKLSREDLCARYYGNLNRINRADWLTGNSQSGIGEKLSESEIHDLETEKARLLAENEKLASLHRRAYQSALGNEEKTRRIDRSFGVPQRHISYYILTKRKISYQSYQDKISELDEEFYGTYRLINHECFKTFNALQKAREEFSVQDAIYADFRHNHPDQIDELKKKLKSRDEGLARMDAAAKAFDHSWQKRKPFSIYVWNESDAIAREAQISMSEDKKTSLIPDPHDTWVRAYGFGPTGQSLARMLFSYTAAFDRNNGETSKFFCEVLDPEGADLLAGLVKLEMPFAAVFADEEGKNHPNLEGEYLARRDAILKEAYRDFAVAKPNPSPSDPTIWDVADGLVTNLFDGNMTQEALTELLESRHNTLLDSSSIENQEIPVPCFYFHDFGIGDIRAMDISSVEAPNHVPFHSPFAPHKEQPDYVLVAIGDDYANIRVANGVIKSLCATLEPDKKVTIFVNVWDEKNNNLVLGFAKARKDAAKGPKKKSEISADAGQVIYFDGPGGKDNIRLIIIGNNADIYQHESILPDQTSRNYNYSYSRIEDPTKTTEEQTIRNDEFSALSNRYFAGLGEYYRSLSRPSAHPAPDDFIESFDLLWQQAKAYVKQAAGEGNDEAVEEAVIAWRSLDVWRRRSSMEAQLSGARFYAELKAWEPRPDEKMEELFCDLARLEHQRWMRLHIADGWCYGSKKNPVTQTHPSILPYAFMRWKTGIYDLMNVYLGIAGGCYAEGRLPDGPEELEPMAKCAAEQALSNYYNDGNKIVCSDLDPLVWKFVQAAKGAEVSRKKNLRILIASDTPCADRNVAAFVLSLPKLKFENDVFSASTIPELGKTSFTVEFQQLAAAETSFGSFARYSGLESAGVKRIEEADAHNQIDESWNKVLDERPVFVLSSDSRQSSSFMLGLAQQKMKEDKLKVLVVLTNTEEFDSLIGPDSIKVFNFAK